MTLYKQIGLIIASSVLVYAWASSPLASYTHVFLGFLVVIYLVLSFSSKSIQGSYAITGQINACILGTALLLFLVTNGGLASPFFFLMYLALFAIAFTFQPFVVFIYAVVITGILGLHTSGDMNQHILKILSFFLVSPIAYYFGKGYLSLDLLNKTSKTTAEAIEEEVEEVLETDTAIAPETKEKLTEVIAEAETLENRNT